MFSSSDIEFKFGLSSGAVRQYIRNHPDLVTNGTFWKVGKTWACSVDTAQRIWGDAEFKPVSFPNMTINFESGHILTFDGENVNMTSPDSLDIVDRKKWEYLIMRVQTAIMREFAE